MNTKVVEFLKSALVICLGILIPLGLCIMFMKSVIRKDALRCVDTFIENENVDLTKYVTLEFEKTDYKIKMLNEQLRILKMSKPEEIDQCLANFSKEHSEFKHIHVYNEKGTLVSSSQKSEAEEQLNDESLTKAKEVSYVVEENSDKQIELKFLMPQQIGDEKCILNFSIDWKSFEQYMTQVTEGSFPRMFYIISPSCKRYISFASLPPGQNSLKNVVALGIHLAGKIQAILTGLSTVSVSSVSFRVVKNEIKLPNHMHGEKFFFVTATDDSTIEKMSADLTENLPIVFYILITVILSISLVISVRLNKILGDLQIANRISNSTPLAIVIFNEETGKVRKINMTATTLLRIQVDKLDQVDMWKMFLSKEDLDYIKNAIDSGITIFNYEVLVQSFEAGTFWAVCSASPIIIDDVKYIVLGILDINHRKEIEKKLANNSEMLERQVAERTADLEKTALELKSINAQLEGAKIAADTANKTKSVFLTNVSSELKTPLNAIIGYAEILKEEAEDRQDNVTADDLGKIMGAANHLLSLINEILDLSQIEAGKVKLFFENFSLGTTLREIESVIMPVVTQNNNSLFIELPKGVDEMYTDETKFRQCILNLLSNAAKFTEFGKITLRARAFVRDGEDFIEISIIDTGSGIDQERLPTLFEGFQGGNADNSAGLGLKITKEYVEYLGGTISVESEVGVGSKFIFAVPRVCKTKASDNIMVENSQQEQEADEISDENPDENEPIE